MDSFTKNKALIWTVGLLVLINIMSIGMLWMTLFRAPAPGSPGGGPEGRGPGHGPGQQLLAQELNLSSTQQDRLRALRQTHFENMNALQHQIHETQRRISEAIFDKTSNADQISVLATDVGQAWSRLELARYQHFKELESLCDVPQKRKLQSLLKDMVQRGAPPPRHQGGPPQGGPDGHRGPPPQHRPGPGSGMGPPPGGRQP